MTIGTGARKSVAEAVVTEDSLHGVLAGKNAGIYNIAIPADSTASGDLSQADCVINTMASLSVSVIRSGLGHHYHLSRVV